MSRYVSAGRGAAQRVRLVGARDVQGVEVWLGVDGDAGQARVTAGPRHPDGDLAAVRDQDFPQFDYRLDRLPQFFVSPLFVRRPSLVRTDPLFSPGGTTPVPRCPRGRA